MAPWSIYASQRADEFVPVTRGSSSALFVGTYLPGNGTTVGMKRSLGAAAKRRNPKLRGRADFDLEARSVLAVVADRHPDLEFNRAVALEARKNISRYVQEDPVGYAKMMLNKVQRMWSRYARGGARHTTWTIRGPHIALVLLALAGLLLGVAAPPLAAAGVHPRRRADLDGRAHARGLPGPLQPAADAGAARRRPRRLGHVRARTSAAACPRRPPRPPPGCTFVEESGRRSCLLVRRPGSVARCDGSLVLACALACLAAARPRRAPRSPRPRRRRARGRDGHAERADRERRVLASS